MKNVLLLYPEMLFYKVSIFNKLENFLEKHGYKLIIWSSYIHDENGIKNFSTIDIKLTIRNFQKIIEENKITTIINILYKRDPGYLFYLFTITYPHLKCIKVVFYGHGINKQKDNFLRNTLYNLSYLFFNGIILYSPNERVKIWRVFHKKITIANNTLDLENRKQSITQSKSFLKNKYGINEEIIILTTGRLQERKRIDLLLRLFADNYSNSIKVGWVIVGPELAKSISEEIPKYNNIYYLGPQYDPDIMGEIFTMSDIYCVPGSLGLGIIEAIYWGLPIITLNIKHGPELYYLRNNTNGFIVDNMNMYLAKLNELIYDSELRYSMSSKCIEIYEDEGKLSNMFNGFKDQLKRFY